MKKLCFLFILFSFLLFSSLLVLGQCPVENSYSYGTNGEAEFSHTYFEGQTATVFAVGYFETEITLGGIGYTTTNAGEVGKYIAKLDTLGNLLESWQVSAGENIVDGGKNQRGYFDPGVLLTSSEIYIPSTYQSADSSFNYVIESYDHSGNLIWAKIFNGGVNEYGNFGFDEIDMDSSGNLILTGVFHDIISYFDQVPVDLGTNGQTTAFIMSINSIDGFLDIFVPIESAGNMELFGLETDENGGVYVSGNSYGATDLNINGNVSNYSGSNSGFIFKMSLEYASDSATLDWINVFSSDLGIEIKALKYEFDSNGSRIHYAAVDYPDRNDSLIVDTKVGALNVNSGAVLWEHEMAVNGWYYLSYSSWLDPLSQAIYYPTWIKSGAQFVTDLYMDGSLLEDSISSLVVIHKFNTVDGASQLISPTVYSFIGDVAVLPSGKVLAQSNYTSAGDNVTLGALNPASYPFFYGYINNSGTNIAPEAILEASTSSGAGVVSYQWYRDGNVLGGATDSIYIPTTAGIYQAEITDAVGCNFKTKSINIIEAGNTLTDSLALVDLYNATNPGDTAWANNSGWLSAPLVQWYGVNLDANGRVNNLDLNNNNLSGVLPQSLSNLDSLEFFFFYANPNLEGDLFSVLKNYRILKRVSAHDCAFTGIIDPAVFKPGLLEIRVFNNVFTGGIPDEIGLATDLEQFNLEGNSLTGSIPISVGALGNMMEFNLSRNGITGIIPIEIGQMESLQFLNLRECSLSGEVPAEILNVSSLIELFIETNNFSGTLPDMLNMPNFRSLAAGNNPNLLVALPDNLGELTQMEILSFWNTRPNGGVFPEGLYNLTNLSSLDLSDQRFTGIIDSRIGNLINLQALYLRNNNLSGDLPAEITSLTNLDTFDVGRNFFTSVPDLSAFPNLQFLRLSNNYFQMEDLQPYTQLGLSFFGYAPQRRIGVNEDLTPTAGTSFTISTAITDFAGTNYQWLFNRDTLSSATALDLTISDFRTFNAGAYVLQAAHPDLPDLVLFSAFYNVKADIGKTKWFVDNDENHTADFRDIYQAISATSLNDTIYIAGSNTAYASADLFSSRVIFGPGYFLAENPNTQFNKVTARTPFLNITKDASGSQVYGMDIELLFLNNQSSSLPDTLKNVVLTGNKVSLLSFGDKNDGIEVGRSFIGNLQINATPATNVFRSYDNIYVHNNIIDSVSSLFRDINSVNNGLNNFVFDNNTISHVSDSINDVVFNNNIININQSGNSVNNGNVNFAAANFVNASGSLSVDNDFLTQDASLGKGAFGGAEPYIMSGLPPIPTIYDIMVGPRLSLVVSARNTDELAINRFRYLYRKDQLNSNSFQVLGFTAARDLSVQFLPNRSAIQANQSYEIVLVAIDQDQKRSHRTYVSYEAIAANFSGTVVDINAAPVNQGDVKIFSINPFANKYDTAAVQQLGGSNTFDFQDLILGDYIILANPNVTEYPDLIPTYLGNTIDWELADTIRLQQSISNVRLEVEKLPAPTAEPQVGSLSGIFEEEYEDADSSLRQVLPRKRVGGAGVSVRRIGNSNKNTSLRLIHANTDLVAYVKTNENGEYEIPSLAEGQYAIRFEYPGVETDETSDVFFDIEDDVSERVQVDAKVENGKIVITNNVVIVSNGALIDLTVSAFPNPANDYLNIGLSYFESGMKLKMIDLEGRLVREVFVSSEATLIYIGDLKQGLYIINLSDNRKLNINLKLIKK